MAALFKYHKFRYNQIQFCHQFYEININYFNYLNKI